MTTEAEKTADSVFDAIAGWVRKLLDKQAARITDLETRTRALEGGGTLESHERRLSRHADHLASIETRLKRLERGNE